MLSIAQKKSVEKNSLPRIVSISTDTINGKYKEVRFAYDKQNRVTSIVDLNCIISNPRIDKPKVDTTKTQFFKYIGNNTMPMLRKMFTYELNKQANKWIWKTNELQYYIYENGKKVRDSVFYRENKMRKGKYAQFENTLETSESTTNRIGDGITRTYIKNGSTYIQELYFDINVIEDFSAYKYASGRDQRIANCGLEKFDAAINPFNQLNIASSLYMEKISFSINEADLISLHKDFHDWGIEFMWHIKSKNNPLIYTIKRGDRYAPPIYDNVHIMYSYNQNKLPVYCVALTKKINNGDDYLGGFVKHFTFRYSNE